MPNLQRNSKMSKEFERSLITDYWHMICHRRELPNSGDFLKFSTSIGDIVVFNDGGNLIAFDNRCPHRGAQMFFDVHGNQPATCRYHGWTFASGKLTIPKIEAFKNCDIESAALNHYLTAWCGDFLFVGIAPIQSLEEQLGDVQEVLENISFNIDALKDINQYVYECYWPLALENALEPYHISMVHPETLAKLELEEGINEFHCINSIWYAPVGNARYKRQLGALKPLFSMDYAYDGYMSIYLFPFTMLSSTFGYSYSMQHFFPKNDTQTNFSSRLLSSVSNNANTTTILDSFFESTAQVNRQVFDEDHSVCKLMPKDAWSSQALRYAASNEEKIAHFRQSCRAHEARVVI